MTYTPIRKLCLSFFTFILMWGGMPAFASASVQDDLRIWEALQKDQTAETISFQQFRSFIDKNHNWPQMTAVQRRFESRLSKTGRYNLDSIVLYFSQHPPLTAAGWEAYLTALARKGQQFRGEGLFRDWWHSAAIPSNDQTRLINRYKNTLSRQDHLKRLDRIIYDKSYTSARALASHLGTGYPELVEARIALRNKKKGVQRAVDKVPASLRNNSGLIYDRIVWRRKNGNVQGAIDLLMNSPAIRDDSIAKLWWRERHILARDLIEEKRRIEAYDLLNQHKQTAALGFSQAEWLKGWLALRYLGRPHQAFQSFEKMYNAVTTPISRARGAYWAGRAAETLGQSDVAKLWYQTAAQYPTTFYGQTAIVKLGQRDSLSAAALGKQRSWSEMQSTYADLYKDSRIQAAMIVNRRGDKKTASIFIRRVLYDIDNANQLQFFEPLVALADKLVLPETAIRIAKKAERHRIFLSDSSYPVVMNKVRRNNPLDPALIHAIIRQESRFDQYAHSPAGALGLMQLMPATAKETAGKLGLSYQKSSLTSRPEYNIILGSEYLSRMLKRYDSAMPLAIASYNAGPGRVDSWLRRFGDPRTRSVDMVDWMETIPIYETRNYVQRVLEAYAVYQIKLPQTVRAGQSRRPGQQRYNQ